MYDIIVHHTGIEAMIMDLNWSGLEKYKYYMSFYKLYSFFKDVNRLKGMPQEKQSS